MDYLDLLLIIMGINRDELEYDWLGFKITNTNYPVCHYIIKRSECGEFDVNNVALLTLNSNKYLEQIEHNNYNIYVELTKILKEINDSKTFPSKNMQLRIIELFDRYDKESGIVVENKIRNLSVDVEAIAKAGILKVNGKYPIYSSEGYRDMLASGYNFFDKKLDNRGKVKRKRKQEYKDKLKNELSKIF